MAVSAKDLNFRMVFFLSYFETPFFSYGVYLRVSPILKEYGLSTVTLWIVLLMLSEVLPSSYVSPSLSFMPSISTNVTSSPSSRFSF